MKWTLEFRPEVRDDVAEAAEWYESREHGLGTRFVDEIIRVWESIAKQPQIGSKRDPLLDIRWRLPEHFPYRVIYRTDEASATVVVIAVLHAARHHAHWKRRTD